MTNPTAILFLAGSMLALSAHAQTSDCRLRGADTLINTGATYKKCLDLSALDNKTVIIPGLKNKLLAFSVRFGPRTLVPRLVRRMQERKRD